MLLLPTLPKPSWAQPISTKYSASGAEVEGYRLTISTSNSTYVAGQLVPLAVSVQNLSTNDGSISVGSGYWHYAFEVTEPGGLPASMTGFGTNAFFPNGIRITSVQVPAGKSFNVYVPLQLLFNMTNTGEYTVTVSRQVPKREGPYREVWLHSGPLKIVITNPQKP